MIKCVHSYTSTYARNRVKLDKITGMNMCQKSLETSQGDKVNILWNQQVQTDRNIPNNKPHIITCDNEKKTCMLIDIAISGDRNVIEKEAEYILKYKDLTIEIQQMRNVKTKLIPVIRGGLGIFQSHSENT